MTINDLTLRNLARVVSEDDTANHSARGWAEVVVDLLDREPEPPTPLDTAGAFGNRPNVRLVVTKAIRDADPYQTLGLAESVRRADRVLAALRDAGYNL